MNTSSGASLLLLLAVAIAMLLAACGDDPSPSAGDGERLQVLATIAPAGALARAVAGEAADVEVLVPPGSDPHDFQLSPRDRREIDDAHLVVRIGLGIDPFVDGVSASRLVTLSDALEFAPPNGSSTDGAGAGSAHDGLDPHIWHHIGYDKLMADLLADAFSSADPANAEAYAANAVAFKERLDEADAKVRSLIDSIPEANRKVVTNHDAFGYFIDRYGLTFVGAVIPSTTTAAEPSAGELAELVETIKREGVKAIFAESSLDPELARQIAQEAGVAVVDDLYVDSLGPPGSGADTIEGMLVANAEKIAGALR